MTVTWPFWNEKRISDVYENIYIRTHIEDWFKIVGVIANQINSVKIENKLILDIGCGEGHTTKQILDRVKGKYNCDILETDKPALEKAKLFLQTENNVGEVIFGGVETVNYKEKYDVIYTSHTNYYWGKDQESYDLQLKNVFEAVKTGGKLLILTLPEKSAHYKVMLHQIYPTYNYSEYIINYYKKNSLKVSVKEFVMRIYVGDILNNEKEYDLAVFYKFIHNTPEYPDKNKLTEFKNKLLEYSKDGYLNFSDHLIIVNK